MVTVRIPDDLKDRIDATRPSTVSREAWVRGALEAVLSEAKGALNPRQSGPAPVPSSESDGVRPAAQPRAHGESLDELVAFTPGTAALHSGLRSNGHPPTCKCWRCEKLDGAA